MAEAVLHHRDDVHEVGAGAVHLVDVGDAGDAVGVRLTPDRLGLRLDPADRAEDRAGAVQDAQGPLDLDGEVDVAGRVDDLDAVVLPEAGRRGGRDRDAALLLLNHPVHRCSAFVDLADLVRLPRVEQDALGRRGLTGIDVGHDADVARLIEGVPLCHEWCLSPSWCGVVWECWLPAVVRERAVGLRHLEQVLTLLDGSADAVGGVHDLVGQTLGHRLLAALAAEADDPADRQRRRATGADLDRHLVGGAADTLRLDLERGRTLSMAFLKTDSGSVLVFVSTMSNAEYTVRSAMAFLPSSRTLLMSCVTSRLL